MLNRYPDTRQQAISGPRGNAGTVWIDLLAPDDAERTNASALLGRDLPTREQISSIELSNRVRSSEDLLCINIPGFVRGDGDHGALTPLGIVLTPTLLVTLRYAASSAFDRVAKIAASAAPPTSSIDAFVNLFESVSATAADHMQALSLDLSKLSHSVFSDSPDHSQMLRGVLFRIGAIQHQLAQVHAAMLGVERGLAHLCDDRPSWIDAVHLGRLNVVLGDLRSLTEFDQQLDDKVQFVLDATLGFINNDQNDTIKVLTIASVVTIPPMILAGIWGMNFKSIPEYNWPHGYAFAWTLIVLSMLLPLAWFKWKRWF